jgi:L-alanine-DL-glutamate epimerase-like enolase superfamily enzyme
MATGENLFSMQDARNLIRYGGMRPDRDWLQFDCALSYGLVEYLRTLDMLQGARLVAEPLHPAWRPPDVAQHRGRPRPRRQRVLSRPVPALWRLPDGVKVENGYITMPDLPGIGFEGKADRRSVHIKAKRPRQETDMLVSTIGKYLSRLYVQVLIGIIAGVWSDTSILRPAISSSRSGTCSSN